VITFYISRVTNKTILSNTSTITTIGYKTTQHIGLTSHCFVTEFVTDVSGNGAERAKTRVERSGVVSGSQKNRAERERGAAERERSGEQRSEKSGLMRSGKTFRSAPLTCSARLSVCPPVLM